ncbi:hypothetical protein [Streptomyces cucumeris]|uniref:hypothetical protein n=1 Tax=Streptomyces cucumeris TaxID=2962890 RepID=UPI0020C8DE7B|nr:hypothetical protein [Streptomyces sp. NEAU-Y11]MCP9207791.1 hypothetical protein [Streptomyces sp. NEAU-Y11]
MTEKTMTAYQYQALKAASVHPHGRLPDTHERTLEAMDEAWYGFATQGDWWGHVITDAGRAAVAAHEENCQKKGKPIPPVSVAVPLHIEAGEWGRFVARAEREGLDPYEKLAQLITENAN